jgi:hypothetical protein
MGRRCRTGILVANFVLALGASCAVAEAPSRFIHDDGKSYRMFQSKPARELMNRHEFQRYQAALKILQCRSAGRQLRDAFTRAYPKFHALVHRQETPLDLKSPSWQRYATVYFKEYGLCNALARVKRFSRQIRERNIALVKYHSGLAADKNRKKRPLISMRDSALSLVISFAASDYPPALFKLAELVRNGNLFDAGADVELYLLARACMQATETDCNSVLPRLQQLRVELSGKASQIMKEARGLHSRVNGVFNFAEPL